MVSTGEELLAVLRKTTAEHGAVRGLVVFSHAGSRGLYMKTDRGFFAEQTGMRQIAMDRPGGARTVEDLAKEMHQQPNGGPPTIAFAESAKIVLVGCNTAGRDDSALARRLTLLSGVTTVAAKGAVGEPPTAPGTLQQQAGGGWFEYRRVLENNKWVVRESRLGPIINPVVHLSRRAAR